MCEILGRCLATQITSESLSFRQGIKCSLLDAVRILVQTHVPQHHEGRKEESGGVGKTLAGDIGGGAVDSLEDGALIADVSGGGQTETTDETGAHVGENVAVQVGHDKDLVVVGKGIGGHLEAGVVEELGVELDVGELLGNLVGHRQEETVAHLHDSRLVHDADLLAADGFGVLEGVAQDSLGSVLRDELDRLDDTVNNNVLNAGVLALGVLADQDRVDIVVRGLVTGNRAARSEVGEEVEGSSESQVERDVTLANRRLKPHSVCLFVANMVRLALLTARGPLSAILFLLMLSMATSGIAVFPSLMIGSTLMGSQVMGVYGAGEPV